MFSYIDLFCGIGGFHQAMEMLGGKCVFASEIDRHCIETYNNNYGMDCGVNIRDVGVDDIPPFDVLCAGFPCQSFSKAGKQEGFNDATKGTLFFNILEILQHHKPKYIILENVKNLVRHDSGNTWHIIQESLRETGYMTTEKPLIISPHQFGIPQIRERVIILGVYNPNVFEHINISFDCLLKKEDNSIYSVLDDNVADTYKITQKEEYVLKAWDEFKVGIKEKVIGFPIWADYFYSKRDDETYGLPEWKSKIIEKNIVLYYNNRDFINGWLEKYNYLKNFNPSTRKLEWQCGEAVSSLWEGIIQFRPSGIRIKRPDCFPALVAMVHTPIVGKYRRRITEREAGRLQSFPDDFILNADRVQAYKQFGNSVNVEVIRACAEKLFAIQP